MSGVVWMMFGVVLIVGQTNYNVLATIDDGTCVYPTDRWSCQNNSVVDGCASRIAIPGGLSYTAAIYGIADLTNQWYDVEFSTLKYTLGGGNQQMQSPEDIKHQLPAKPCEHPCSPPSQDCVDGIATWGQPGPYYAYIKYVMYSGLPGLQFTTWKSFIDAYKHFRLFVLQPTLHLVLQVIMVELPDGKI